MPREPELEIFTQYEIDKWKLYTKYVSAHSLIETNEFIDLPDEITIMTLTSYGSSLSGHATREFMNLTMQDKINIYKFPNIAELFSTQIRDVYRQYIGDDDELTDDVFIIKRRGRIHNINLNFFTMSDGVGLYFQAGVFSDTPENNDIMKQETTWDEIQKRKDMIYYFTIHNALPHNYTEYTNGQVWEWVNKPDISYSDKYDRIIVNVKKLDDDLITKIATTRWNNIEIREKYVLPMFNSIDGRRIYQWFVNNRPGNISITQALEISLLECFKNNLIPSEGIIWLFVCRTLDLEHQIPSDEVTQEIMDDTEELALTLKPIIDNSLDNRCQYISCKDRILRIHGPDIDINSNIYCKHEGCSSCDHNGKCISCKNDHSIVINENTNCNSCFNLSELFEILSKQNIQLRK